ncbi:MAG: PASTA domain-containing protein [Gordonia sp. (in: high G+C Gram-positive bacteria)]|uniref:PASTA domain-containing protein n=1 Tax=Gordonia sp. (in: high G+C Gram-positive bacteria) TaxID=84139 RepID=UPI0039E4704A
MRINTTTKACAAIAAVGIGLLTLTGCGGAKNDAPATVTVVSTETVEQAAPTETPKPTATPRPTPAESSVPKPGQAQEGFFVMPNVVGMGLQAAQDEMQRITGNPGYFTSSTDATGAGRQQVMDRNWKVCTQSVPPGTQVRVMGPTISFGAVKLSEQCP